jgi:hypothetical protein
MKPDYYLKQRVISFLRENPVKSFVIYIRSFPEINAYKKIKTGVGFPALEMIDQKGYPIAKFKILFLPSKYHLEPAGL